MTTGLRLRKVLVANRGEIAVRIVRACHDEDIEAVVVVSDADVDSLAARHADDVVHIGRPSPADSYLRVEQVVAGALLAGCDAVHPGYGFLSERPELAAACAANGLVFVGPDADTIRRGGDKVRARELAHAVGLPVGLGSGTVSSAGEARAVADHIGYPVLLKAAAGGGGRGMFRVDSGDELDGRFSTAAGEAAAAFGDGRLYVERFVDNARHVEVQLLADRDGRIVQLGDRDCSVQRRFQKMVEEAPSAVLSPELHERLGAAAVALGGALGYTGAGTVEFLVDLDRGEFSFVEINTRLQVEHPVTEQATGVDIVREQLRIAAGRPLSFTQDEVVIRGHTIECRVNAEDADGGFVPSPGVIERWCPPTGEGVRLDTHVVEGYEVTPYYDSMIAKLIVTGADRGHAVDAMIAALDAFVIDGVDTTLHILRRIVDHPDFRADAVDTTWLERVVLDHADAASGAPLAGGG